MRILCSGTAPVSPRHCTATDRRVTTSAPRKRGRAQRARAGHSIKDFKQKGICKIDKKEIDKELFTELKKTNIIPFDLNYEKIKDFKSLFNNMKITTERNPQFDFLER